MLVFNYRFFLLNVLIWSIFMLGIKVRMVLKSELDGLLLFYSFNIIKYTKDWILTIISTRLLQNKDNVSIPTIIKP